MYSLLIFIHTIYNIVTKLGGVAKEFSTEYQY